MINPSDAEILAAKEAAMVYMLRHNIGRVAEMLKNNRYLPDEITATMRREIETGRQADAAMASIIRDAVRECIVWTDAYHAALNRELQK